MGNSLMVENYQIKLENNSLMDESNVWMDKNNSSWWFSWGILDLKWTNFCIWVNTEEIIVNSWYYRGNLEKYLGSQLVELTLNLSSS